MDAAAPADLTGRSVAVPETRLLDVLAAMFEQRGATVIRCPLVAILDAPDPAPVNAWLDRFIAGGCDDLVLLTGEGLRRLIAAAGRRDAREPFLAALARVRTLTRGPKPVRALREVGLEPTLTAAEPTTAGVIATLAGLDLPGRTIGIQLYGEEPNRPLIAAIEAAGAVADPVAPYVYASKADDARVVELIHGIAAGEVDVIAFTSASQVDRLWAVAERSGLGGRLRDALPGVMVASVGPVTADTARRYGMTTAVMPERTYFMKPLVNEIAAALRPRR